MAGHPSEKRLGRYASNRRREVVAGYRSHNRAKAERWRAKKVTEMAADAVLGHIASGMADEVQNEPAPISVRLGEDQ